VEELIFLQPYFMTADCLLLQREREREREGEREREIPLFEPLTFFFFLFEVLGLELRAFTLSDSTSPIFV
jgi:hypothetical protein